MFKRVAYRAVALQGVALEWLEGQGGDVVVKYLPDLNRVGGTAVDKSQLLDGAPTERVAVSDDHADTEVAADVVDFLEQVKRRRAGGRKTG